MGSYFNRLECLIEKWQSRRRTLEISAPRAKQHHQQQQHQADSSQSKLKPGNKSTQSGAAPLNAAQEQENIEPPRPQEEVPRGVEEEAAAGKLLGEHSSSSGDGSLEARTGGKSANFNRKQAAETTALGELAARSLKGSRALSTCPSLLYASLFIITCCCVHLATATRNQQSQQEPLKAAASISSEPLEATVGNIIKSPSTSSLSPQGAEAAAATAATASSSAVSQLIQQLAAAATGAMTAAGKRPAATANRWANLRDRWIHIPSTPTSIRDQLRRPPRGPTRRDRLLTRISNRIGSRNTIRVHNAFRDLAWRLLESLSMPTPVIYELRRQQFYSPAEDVKNDLLFNKNTTKTIRTRRSRSHSSGSTPLVGEMSVEDERRRQDEEEEDLRER